FRTATPRSIVMLGCRKAGAVAAELDNGRLPVLRSGEDGYSVLIDSPGQHTLTLDLEVPLVTRGAKGGERRFALYLPGARITLLEAIKLPAGGAGARFSASTNTGGTGPSVPLPAGTDGAVALGPVTRIDLSWDAPAPQRTAEPILSAKGSISVRVEE